MRWERDDRKGKFFAGFMQDIKMKDKKIGALQVDEVYIDV
jgi:hypothetical protein